MSSEYEGSAALLARTADFIGDHKRLYLESGGAKGHIMDLTHAGARGLLPTLLLETIGRRSKRRHIAPLIYGCYAGEWIIVGSKGGAPEHPSWFLNLREQAEVRFQVATQGFRAKWRLLEGRERATVWEYMAALFPPYADYVEGAGDRVIPLIALIPLGTTPIFEADAADS